MSKLQKNHPSGALVSGPDPFYAGRCTDAWKRFGAHPCTDEAGRAGFRFPILPMVLILIAFVAFFKA